MIDEMIRYKVEFLIRDVLRMIDASSLRHDLIPHVNTIQVMNRGHLSHLAIEQGLKVLTACAGGKIEESHALLKLLNRLRDMDEKTADFLGIAFQDAVAFYGYNTNRDGFAHLKCLETYFAKVGGTDAFEKYRYWSIAEITDSNSDFPPIFLPIHRELLVTLERLVGVSQEQTVSQRVGWAIVHAMFDPHSLAYDPADKEHAAAVKGYTEWMPKRVNRCQATFAEAAENNYDVGLGPFATNILRQAHQTMRDSEDPAVRHFAATLDRLSSKGLPRIHGYTPRTEWIDQDVRAFVKTPSGTNIGYLEKTADSNWHAAPDGTQPSVFARTFADAKTFVIHHTTRRFDVLVNGIEEKSLRVLNDSDHLMSNRDTEWTTEVDFGPEDYELEFWDDTHGLQIGDAIKAKMRHQENSEIVSVLDGEVTSMDDQHVTVKGMSWIDLADTNIV